MNTLRYLCLFLALLAFDGLTHLQRYEFRLTVPRIDLHLTFSRSAL